MEKTIKTMTEAYKLKSEDRVKKDTGIWNVGLQAQFSTISDSGRVENSE